MMRAAGQICGERFERRQIIVNARGAHQRRADDDAVGHGGDRSGLLAGVDAEANCQGRSVWLTLVHKRGQVRRQFAGARR